MDVLGFSRAKDSVLVTCARNVWLLTPHYNIALVVLHLEDRENTVADLLSRWSDIQEDQARLHELVPAACWVNIYIDLLLLNHDL